MTTNANSYTDDEIKRIVEKLRYRFKNTDGEYGYMDDFMDDGAEVIEYLLAERQQRRVVRDEIVLFAAKAYCNAIKSSGPHPHQIAGVRAALEAALGEVMNIHGLTIIENTGFSFVGIFGKLHVRAMFLLRCLWIYVIVWLIQTCSIL